MSQMFESYPDMLTVEQLAQALNIGRTLAYRLVRAGKVHSVRLGAAIRIPKAALVSALARTEATAGQSGGGGVVA